MNDLRQALLENHKDNDSVLSLNQNQIMQKNYGQEPKDPKPEDKNQIILSQLNEALKKVNLDTVNRDGRLNLNKEKSSYFSKESKDKRKKKLSQSSLLNQEQDEKQEELKRIETRVISDDADFKNPRLSLKKIDFENPDKDSKIEVGLKNQGGSFLTQIQKEHGFRLERKIIPELPPIIQQTKNNSQVSNKKQSQVSNKQSSQVSSQNQQKEKVSQISPKQCTYFEEDKRNGDKYLKQYKISQEVTHGNVSLDIIKMDAFNKNFDKLTNFYTTNVQEKIPLDVDVNYLLLHGFISQGNSTYYYKKVGNQLQLNVVRFPIESEFSFLGNSQSQNKIHEEYIKEYTIELQNGEEQIDEIDFCFIQDVSRQKLKDSDKPDYFLENQYLLVKPMKMIDKEKSNGQIKQNENESHKEIFRIYSLKSKTAIIVENDQSLISLKNTDSITMAFFTRILGQKQIEFNFQCKYKQQKKDFKTSEASRSEPLKHEDPTYLQKNIILLYNEDKKDKKFELSLPQKELDNEEISSYRINSTQVNALYEVIDMNKLFPSESDYKKTKQILHSYYVTCDGQIKLIYPFYPRQDDRGNDKPQDADKYNKVQKQIEEILKIQKDNDNCQEKNAICSFFDDRIHYDFNNQNIIKYFDILKNVNENYQIFCTQDMIICTTNQHVEILTLQNEQKNLKDQSGGVHMEQTWNLMDLVLKNFDFKVEKNLYQDNLYQHYKEGGICNEYLENFYINKNNKNLFTTHNKVFLNDQKFEFDQKYLPIYIEIEDKQYKLNKSQKNKKEQIRKEKEFQLIQLYHDSYENKIKLQKYHLSENYAIFFFIHRQYEQDQQQIGGVQFFIHISIKELFILIREGYPLINQFDSNQQNDINGIQNKIPIFIPHDLKKIYKLDFFDENKIKDFEDSSKKYINSANLLTFEMIRDLGEYKYANNWVPFIFYEWIAENKFEPQICFFNIEDVSPYFQYQKFQQELYIVDFSENLQVFRIDYFTQPDEKYQINNIQEQCYRKNIHALQERGSFLFSRSSNWIIKEQQMKANFLFGVNVDINEFSFVDIQEFEACVQIKDQQTNLVVDPPKFNDYQSDIIKKLNILERKLSQEQIEVTKQFSQSKENTVKIEDSNKLEIIINLGQRNLNEHINLTQIQQYIVIQNYKNKKIFEEKLEKLTNKNNQQYKGIVENHRFVPKIDDDGNIFGMYFLENTLQSVRNSTQPKKILTIDQKIQKLQNLLQVQNQQKEKIEQQESNLQNQIQQEKEIQKLDDKLLIYDQQNKKIQKLESNLLITNQQKQMNDQKINKLNEEIKTFQDLKTQIGNEKIKILDEEDSYYLQYKNQNKLKFINDEGKIFNIVEDSQLQFDENDQYLLNGQKQKIDKNKFQELSFDNGNQSAKIFVIQQDSINVDFVYNIIQLSTDQSTEKKIFNKNIPMMHQLSDLVINNGLIVKHSIKTLYSSNNLRNQVYICSTKFFTQIIESQFFNKKESTYWLMYYMKLLLCTSLINFKELMSDTENDLKSQKKIESYFQPRFQYSGANFFHQDFKNIYSTANIENNKMRQLFVSFKNKKLNKIDQIDPMIKKQRELECYQNIDSALKFKRSEQNQLSFFENSILHQACSGMYNFKNQMLDIQKCFGINQYFNLQFDFQKNVSIVQEAFQKKNSDLATLVIDFILQNDSEPSFYEVFLQDLPLLIHSKKFNVLDFLSLKIQKEVSAEDITDAESQDKPKKKQLNNLERLLNSDPQFGEDQLQHALMNDFRGSFWTKDEILEYITKSKLNQGSEKNEEESGGLVPVEYTFINFEALIRKIKFDKILSQLKKKDDKKSHHFSFKNTDPKSINLIDDLFLATIINYNEDTTEIIESSTIQKIINSQFLKTKDFIHLQLIIYILGFFIPFIFQIFQRNYFYDYYSTDPYMITIKYGCQLLAGVTLFVFLTFEFADMYFNTFLNYINDIWNIIDISQVVFYSIHIFIIGQDYPQLQVYGHLRLFDSILQILIVLQAGSKILYLIKYNDKYSSLVQMMTQVFIDVIPFVIVFGLYVLMFSFISIVLEAYYGDDDTGDYNDFPKFLIVLFSTFRTSIGDLKVNTYGAWMRNSTDDGSTDYLTDDIKEEFDGAQSIAIFFIWVFWTANVFGMMVILMNFLIAEISMTFERAKEEGSVLLNREKARFNQKVFEIWAFFGYRISYNVFIFQQNSENLEGVEIDKSNQNLIESINQNTSDLLSKMKTDLTRLIVSILNKQSKGSGDKLNDELGQIEVGLKEGIKEVENIQQNQENQKKEFKKKMDSIKKTQGEQNGQLKKLQEVNQDLIKKMIEVKIIPEVK